jgi:hypothetical protein
MLCLCSGYTRLVRRLALCHARLHLRSEVSLLDMSVAIMLGEEHVALMHGSNTSVFGWNRMDCPLGQLSIDRLAKKSGQTSASQSAKAASTDRASLLFSLIRHGFLVRSPPFPQRPST